MCDLGLTQSKSKQSGQVKQKLKVVLGTFETLAQPDVNVDSSSQGQCVMCLQEDCTKYFYPVCECWVPK